ncbi:MAG TPA: alanine/ornithine racemase family PLP-dependent enzyme [Eubacteriales bacterium]|nr:alanine/ornithine racemase family PLP-dependent enzyme [Eubacteriales bacterium]
MNPTLNVNLIKLKASAETLVKKLSENNITTAFVTKVFCADNKMTDVLNKTDCAFLADSRIENLIKYGETKKQKMLLRLPSISEAERVVKYSDISCNSSKETVMALNKAAAEQNKIHKVLLMIDLGDLREGIFYTNTALIDGFVETVNECRNIRLAGLGTNITCYGGVLPTEENMGVLLNIAKHIEEKYKLKLDIISGGNSSSILFLDSGKMPKGINNLRLGESLVLGVETAKGSRISDTYDDAVTLTAEIIELYVKPSYPIGEQTVNAFGEKGVYVDIGDRTRGILAVGRQDVDFEGLIPVDEKLTIISASSDHLLVDFTDAKNNYKIGDTVTFKLKYGAALRAFTSPYVDKKYIE